MQIQPYGTMVAVGILVAGALGLWLSKRLEVDFNDIILLFVYGISLGFVGAKGAYLLLNFQRIPWREVGVMRVLEDGGFIFYGGIPLGALGLWLAQKIHRLDLNRCLRVCAPLLPLGHGFGRVGCHLAGCCYGVAYSGPFAHVYHGSLIAPNDTPLFPVQLLEAVLLVALSGVLLWALLKGWVLFRLVLLYFCSYAIIRFGLEFLRGDLERGFKAGLSTSQWVSLMIVFLAVCYKRYRCKRRAA